jgi:hypothetical protein
MGIFSFVKPGKKIFNTISSVTPKVNKTKLDKAKSKLAIATQKTKASTAKLGQTIFESKNKAFKGKDFTFATKKGKSESNKEAYKRIQGENTKVLKGMIDDAFKDTKKKTKVFKAPENFNKGGRVGLKRGTFPDHSGDGQITQKDILMAKGVIPKPKGKKKMMAKKSKSPMDKQVRKA